jgi:hypothetical protein
MYSILHRLVCIFKFIKTKCGTECPAVFTDVLNYIQLNSQYDRETDSVPKTQFTIIFTSPTLSFFTPLLHTVHAPGLRTFCVHVWLSTVRETYSGYGRSSSNLIQFVFCYSEILFYYQHFSVHTIRLNALGIGWYICESL